MAAMVKRWCCSGKADVMTRARAKSRSRHKGKSSSSARWKTDFSVTRASWFSWLALIAVTLLAYGNAIHSEVVWDDRVFLEASGFQHVSPRDFPGFFTQSLWEAAGNQARLYRPMILLTFGVESLVFDDWWTGYHIVNVLMHVMATLLVYGFSREFLFVTGVIDDRSSPAVLLAAMVFGVHPVFGDAVNSLFNGTEIFATAAVVGSLLYLLHHRQRSLLLTWSVVSLIFLLGLMYRESAVALMPLAAITLWFASDKPWLQRVRECLPVLFLLLPLALYFILRSNAFEIPGDPVADAVEAMGREPLPQLPAAENSSRDVLDAAGLVVINPSKLASVVSLWFEALRLMVWPQPLLVIRQPPDTSFYVAFSVQAALFALVLRAAVRRQTVFLFGLFFFYLAILPSSRIVSEGSLPPLLMDRMLYLPSTGLVILLAVALAGLSRRISFRASLVTGLMLVILLVPVTWGRNHDWSSDLGLLQADFAKNPVNNRLLISLIDSHARAGNLARANELCTSDTDRVEKILLLNRKCANVFMARGMMEQAEHLLLQTVKKRPKLSWVHLGLGTVYARTDRRDLAREHFDMALEREQLPFLREMIQASALLELYPGDRYRQKQARAHLERALELQPRAIQARQLLEQLEAQP